jgi:cation diffusion facilitator CzcD-associated flavoprotein CzcO
VNTHVAIIGAGPYGLSLSAHLSARGVEHRIFGTAMETWERHMPRGMFLKSEGFASNIADPASRWTLANFCRDQALQYDDVGWPIPVETFSAYGRWFQEKAVPHVEDERVVTVAEVGGEFAVELASGARFTAERVVIASGIREFAYVPPELAAAAPGVVTHTSAHADFRSLRGARVAVVGAGQSALEAAALLAEAGAHPELVVRSSRLNWNPDPAAAGYSRSGGLHLRPTPLGAGRDLWAYWHTLPMFRLLPDDFRTRFVRETLGPSGAWWLRSRVDGRVPATLGATVVDVAPAGHDAIVQASVDGESREIRVDHVIAGTGYRVDIDQSTVIAPDLRREVSRLPLSPGAPRLTRRFESSVPGLHFIGLAAATTFGPAMRFVCGTGFAARAVARGAAQPRT